MKNILKTFIFLLAGMVLAASTYQKNFEPAVKPVISGSENCARVIKIESSKAGLHNRITFTYNQQGKVEQMVEYNADSSQVEKYRYIRNKSGALITQEYLDKYNYVVGYTTYTYNSNNQIVQVSTFDNLKVSPYEENRIMLDYNESGFLSKYSTYVEENDIWQLYEYTTFTVHDAEGNPIEAQIYSITDPSGPVEFLGTLTLSYDNKPNPWQDLKLPYTYVDFLAFSVQTPSRPINKISLVAPGSASSNQVVFNNKYDANNRLTSQTYTNLDGTFSYHFQYPDCK